jgi:hypothetical protein
VVFDTEGRMILKYLLRKWGIMICTECTWLWTTSSGDQIFLLAERASVLNDSALWSHLVPVYTGLI